MTYREFTLPKRAGGFRKITAPDPDLLRYQRSKLRQLELLWQDVATEYDVEDIQHGFIRNRNAVTAASQHIGFRTTISMDIADFFDNVTSDMLSRFSTLVGQDSYLYHADGYCSQGFATSPILCNIALIPAIADIRAFLETQFDSSYAFTVYADDLTISCNIAPDDYNMLNYVPSEIQRILESHHFAVKPSKTRTRFSDYGFRRVLGIMVGDDTMKVPRKTRFKLRAAKHQRNGPSIGGLTTWSRLLPPKALR